MDDQTTSRCRSPMHDRRRRCVAVSIRIVVLLSRCMPESLPVVIEVQKQAIIRMILLLWHSAVYTLILLRSTSDGILILRVELDRSLARMSAKVNITRLHFIITFTDAHSTTRRTTLSRNASLHLGHVISFCRGNRDACRRYVDRSVACLVIDSLPNCFSCTY